MMIGWGYILISGAFIGRYGRGMNHQDNFTWFILHIIVQTTGLCLTLAALVIIFDFNAGVHFRTTWHGQFGLTLMILLWLHCITAIFRPFPPAEGEDPSTARVVWEYAHRIIACLMVVMSIINIFQGINQQWYAIYDLAWPFALYAATMGSILTLGVILEVMLQSEILPYKEVMDLE
eukprot:TRINITY_DN5719_c0_g1_i1.p2 TRINITY_DN5719_c0_g1~~TRINITY_DN5719_c0_g1_i1.p2  ORF type:complete len:177 (-),score=22.61 TRINITY_DN5719_c0_g1_i1:60-590(-)